MKRLFVLLIGLWLAVSAALATVNTTLNQAQELLMNARTLDDYKKAKKKFESAIADPGYVQAEHEEARAQGIKACDAKITQFSAKITVNGSTSPAVDFEAEGGLITLDVRSSQGGRIKTKSSAPWVSAECIAKDSIAITCQPNEGKEMRTATVTVSVGGANVKVNVSQGFIEFVISDITIGSVDANGTEILRPGQSLVAEKMLYIEPQFTISGLPAPVDKKVCIRLLGPDRKLIASANSPDGYTDGKTMTLWPGEKVIKFPRRGSDLPGSWTQGTYTLEVWVDDKKEASKTFKVFSYGLSVWDIDFAATDKKGRPTSAYGAPLYEEDAKCISPRIIYCGVPTEKIYTLRAKVFRSDGSLDRNKKSPAGFSYEVTTTLRPGTNVLELPAWGSGKNGAYPEGTYQYDLWADDKIVYSTKFYVASKKNPLSINAVEYASVDNASEARTQYGAALNSSDLQYLQPRIHYSGLKKEVNKTVIVKIFKPDGSMMRQPNSPAGCTYSCTVRLAPGENTALVAAYGSAEGGTFAPGTYKIEYWIDGMLMHTDSLTIN